MVRSPVGAARARKVALTAKSRLTGKRKRGRWKDSGKERTEIKRPSGKGRAGICEAPERRVGASRPLLLKKAAQRSRLVVKTNLRGSI